MDGIGALILAAGNSSRLGQPKQFLKIGGRTLLERTIGATEHTVCGPIIVVTGAVEVAEESGERTRLACSSRRPAARRSDGAFSLRLETRSVGSACRRTPHAARVRFPEAEFARVWFVANADWKCGIGTSIRAGVAKLKEIGDAPAAVVILVCDQPHVNAEVIQQLIHKFRETQKPIVASRYAKTLGVPALFARENFAELETLADDAGAKSIILADLARVAAIDFPAGAIDIDTPADLASLPTA